MKDFKIVSFNIRCVWIGDGINGFVHRAGMVLHKIRTEKPHVICFQEMIDNTAQFLEENLWEYNMVIARRGANYDGEGVAIAYRRDSFDLFSVDSMWLSPTPTVPGSRYPGQSGCPRVFQSAILRRKSTGELIRVINTHLDYVGDDITDVQLGQIIDYLSEKNAEQALPFFILGDFNAQPDSAALQRVRNAADPEIRDLTEEIPHTCHEYGNIDKDTKVDLFGRDHRGLKIDYILSDKDTAALSPKVTLWDEVDNGIYLSDHYPVCAEFE